MELFHYYLLYKLSAEKKVLSTSNEICTVYITVAKWFRPVSLKLSIFLTSWYDINDTRIGWLCAKRGIFESNEMEIHQPMQTNNNRSPNDDEFRAEDDITSDEDDDEEIDIQVSFGNEEYEDNDYMNDNMKTMAQDDDEESDAESIDGEPGDVSCELECHQNEAI